MDSRVSQPRRPINKRISIEEITAMDRALIDMAVKGLENTETFKAMKEIWKERTGREWGVRTAGSGL